MSRDEGLKHFNGGGYDRHGDDCVRTLIKGKFSENLLSDKRRFPEGRACGTSTRVPAANAARKPARRVRETFDACMHKPGVSRRARGNMRLRIDNHDPPERYVVVP